MEIQTAKPGVEETRRKLLEAAAYVFARSGLEGATTRAIAREAGVNEVTLFRHFQSKEKLLAAVLQRTFDRPEESLDEEKPEDLREGLRRYAKRYDELLHRNILLMRTLLGEIHRHSEHEVKVFKGIFAPLKVDLIALIHAARERGVVRAEVDPLLAADLFGGMIFVEVLRRNSPFVPEYPTETYLETALEVFVRGIEQR